MTREFEELALDGHNFSTWAMNAHNMCAQELSFHTYCIENGYKITNVTIYNIYYTNNVLQKTKSNTLKT
jgi:hypothetical protein